MEGTLILRDPQIVSDDLLLLLRLIQNPLATGPQRKFGDRSQQAVENPIFC
mgnify:CR=1 FL=1